MSRIDKWEGYISSPVCMAVLSFLFLLLHVAELHHLKNLRVCMIYIILIAKALCMVKECSVLSTDFKICILTKREHIFMIAHEAKKGINSGSWRNIALSPSNQAF